MNNQHDKQICMHHHNDKQICFNNQHNKKKCLNKQLINNPARMTTILWH